MTNYLKFTKKLKLNTLKVKDIEKVFLIIAVLDIIAIVQFSIHLSSSVYSLRNQVTYSFANIYYSYLDKMTMRFVGHNFRQPM